MRANSETVGGTNGADGCGLGGKRVLVVEDQYYVAADICRYLESIGASATMVSTCPEGLEALNSFQFDFAVLDIKLGIDETCYPVASELVRLGVPFVFLTGYDCAREEFAAAPTLRKPCDANVVARALSRLAVS